MESRQLSNSATAEISPSAASALPDPADFAHVTEWVFDLDNTLYPHHSNLFSQIDVKMTSYVSRLLQLPREEARAVQKRYYLEHGTTLAGLMANHGIAPDDFLEKVHDIDYSWLAPDPKLGDVIRKLPGRKIIFTNGSRQHAESTARQLGILDHFDEIFDIVAAGLVPKPAREAYDKFLGLHKVEASKAAFFEDLGRNLIVPKALGMRTVLIVPNNMAEEFADAWHIETPDTRAVDHITDDLTAFLEALVR
jgi:putative hydrolase of the HAD superfamily